MVFHADYEIEFEIHKKRADDWRTDYLGYIAGMTAQDALDRWIECHNTSNEIPCPLQAIPVVPRGKI